MLIYRKSGRQERRGLCWTNNHGDELPYPRKLLAKLADFIVHLLKMQEYCYLLLPGIAMIKSFLRQRMSYAINIPLVQTETIT